MSSETSVPSGPFFDPKLDFFSPLLKSMASNALKYSFSCIFTYKITSSSLAIHLFVLADPQNRGVGHPFSPPLEVCLEIWSSNGSGAGHLGTTFRGEAYRSKPEAFLTPLWQAIPHSIAPMTAQEPAQHWFFDDSRPNVRGFSAQKVGFLPSGKTSPMGFEPGAAVPQDPPYADWGRAGS